MLPTVSLMEFVLNSAARQHAAVLSEAAFRYDIFNDNRIGCWLGQMHVESGGFTVVRENLNYSVEALLNKFGRHRISARDAVKYGRIKGKQAANQEAIANCLYGGEWGYENLGNIYPGDGWLFIGHGFKQVTGRKNHKIASINLFGDKRLLQNPRLLEQPLYAALSAGEYWKRRGCNPLADSLDIPGITKAVTGSSTWALDDRTAQTRAYLRRIEAARPDFSNVVGGVRTNAD